MHIPMEGSCICTEVNRCTDTNPKEANLDDVW